MNEKDYNVKSAETYVIDAEIKLKEAQINLDEGYKKLKAEFEKEYQKLKLEVDKAKNQLQRDIIFLEKTKAAQERGFDINYD